MQQHAKWSIVSQNAIVFVNIYIYIFIFSVFTLNVLLKF